MTQINLLPENLVPVKEKRRRKIVFNIKSPLLTVGGIIFILIFIWICLSISIAGRRKELSRIEGEWQTVRPLLMELEELVQRKKQLEDKLIVLRVFLGRKILWSEKLSQLRNIISEQTWLTSISSKEGKKEEEEFLNIKGAVTSLKGESMLTTMAEFVGRIKEDRIFFQDFQGLELKNVKKSNVGGIDVMTFELILRLNAVKNDGSNDQLIKQTPLERGQ